MVSLTEGLHLLAQSAYPPGIDAHGHGPGDESHGGHHAAHGPEPQNKPADKDSDRDSTDAEKGLSRPSNSLDDSASAQIIGVAILEFGVLLHRCVSRNLHYRIC